MYRTVDTTLWGDPWFQGLSPDAKYLYLYLKTNGRTTGSGAYQISLKTIVFETGMASEASVVNALREMPHSIVQTWLGQGYIFLVEALAEANVSRGRFFEGAIKQAATLPTMVRQAVYDRYPNLCTEEILVEYPMDTHSIPIEYPIQSLSEDEERVSPVEERVSLEQYSTETETEQVQTEPEQKQTPPPAEVARDFNALMRSYPAARRINIPLAKREWLTAWNAGEVPTIIEILRALNAHKESSEWTKDGGQFIPGIDKYIAARMWEAPPINKDPEQKRQPSQAEMNAPSFKGRFVQ